MPKKVINYAMKRKKKGGMFQAVTQKHKATWYEQKWLGKTEWLGLKNQSGTNYD